MLAENAFKNRWIAEKEAGCGTGKMNWTVKYRISKKRRGKT